MLFVLVSVVLILCFARPSSKVVSLLTLFALWFLFAFNDHNADYRVYVNIFRGISSGNARIINNYEEGYVFLCRVASNVFHMDYKGFIILIATITTILLGIVVALFTANNKQNIAYALFGISIYAVMTTQYRSYIAFLFVLMGLYFYFTKESISGDILLAASIIIASLFHRSALFCLIYIPTRRWKAKTIALTAPIFFFIIVMLRTGPIAELASRYIATYKVQRLFLADSNRSMWGVSLSIVLRAILVLVEFRVYKTINRISEDEKTKKVKRMMRFIMKITMISFVFLALEIFTEDFERLFRVPVMLFFVFFTLYAQVAELNFRKLTVSYISQASYCVLYIIGNHVAHTSWLTTTLIPLLTENYIIRGPL